MIKLLGKGHKNAVIAYTTYLLGAIIFGIMRSSLSLWALWINIGIVSLSFVLIFGVFVFRTRSVSTTVVFCKKLLSLFWWELCFNSVLLVIVFIVQSKFPNWIYILSIPPVLYSVFKTFMIFQRDKYIDEQIMEEKATVQMQMQTIVMIDRSAALGYSYKITDALDSLSNKIRTMGLGTNSTANNLSTQISEKISILNQSMREKADEAIIITSIKEICNIIDCRSNYNRR